MVGSDGRTPDAPGDDAAAARSASAPRWSPDSKKLRVLGQDLRRCGGATSPPASSRRWTRASTARSTTTPGRRDSRWLAYTQGHRRRLQQRPCSTRSSGGKRPPSSTGMTDDFSPAFDPDGEYLYFVSRRTFHPEFGAVRAELPVHAPPTRSTRCRCATPCSPRSPPQSDEETGEATKDKGGEQGREDGQEGREGRRRTRRRSRRSRRRSSIDLAGLGDAGRGAAGPGRPLRRRCTRSRASWCSSRWTRPIPTSDGRGAGIDPRLRPREARGQDRPLRRGRDRLPLSKDGGKVLYRKRRDRTASWTSPRARRSGDGKLATGQLMALRGPAPGVDADVRRGLAARARLLLRPGHGRPRLEGGRRALPPARAVRRAPRRPQLHPRRADRRAVHLAHLRRRRRRAAGAARGRRPARRRLRAGRRERPVPLRDRSTAARDWNSRRRGAARRARHRRAARATTCWR